MKSLSEFPNEKRNSDGKSGRCKPCQKILPGSQENNPDAKRRRSIAYMSKPKSEVRRKAWYEANKEEIKQKAAKRAKAKRAEIREWAKGYRDRNRAKIRKYHREYHARRKKSDLSYKVVVAQRMILGNTLRSAGKGRPGGRTTEALGYSADQLMRTLSARFKPGMSWDNYGEWQIDHKIPVSHFVKKGETRPHIINALCNLQPLWANDNRRKRDTHPLRGAVNELSVTDRRVSNAGGDCHLPAARG